MKILRLWQITVAMTAVITLTSCNSDEYDGDWDDMIWKTEVKS